MIKQILTGKTGLVLCTGGKEEKEISRQAT
jgi:hypothetical protein